MSPLKIKMLLHYYACARDYRDEVPAPHANSEAVKEALREFLDQGLIERANLEWRPLSTETSEFSVTDKGRSMVEHLMAVQVPVCKWVQPEIATIPSFLPGGIER